MQKPPDATRRTVVLTDLHGDLDVLLKSLAAKGVLEYQGELDAILGLIEKSADSSFIPELEASVYHQHEPMLLVFLGDMLDRWPEGYHLIRFLGAIRWQRFAIEPVFILGNHDLQNFQFFVNPFKAHLAHQESGHDIADIVHFISEIGMASSLESFMDVHGEEIRALQEDFYRSGGLQWDLGYATISLRYQADLSPLLHYRGETKQDLHTYYRALAAQFGFEETLPVAGTDPSSAFFRGLQTYADPQSVINYWDINPTDGNGTTIAEYDSKIGRFNIFRRKPDPDDHLAFYEDFREVMPVDWRVISLVWRRHYGDYFRHVKQIHREGDTIFVHGGLSPRVLIDSQSLGLLYQTGQDDFISCTEPYGQSLTRVVDRANRLAGQVIENALNDYSFRCMSGTEMTDLIGSWRGGRSGFTQFGGVYWSDFNHLDMSLESDARLRTLYQNFISATGVRRIICGHTRFEDSGQPPRQYKQIEELHKLGLEYICLDNSCSRGYRLEPILNGIEIDTNGYILDPGGVPLQTT